LEVILMMFIIPIILIALVMLPLLVAYRNMVTGKKTGNAKKAIILNLAGFAVVCLLGIVLPLGGFVSAASATGTGAGLGYLAAALSTGLACVGAGIAVANGSAAAIGAITEDPKVFGRAMIFVVLGEGIAVYGLVISFMIISRIV
jgi:V/A-type H+-transporting ATPase subunit K